MFSNTYDNFYEFIHLNFSELKYVQTVLFTNVQNHRSYWTQWANRIFFFFCAVVNECSAMKTAFSVNMLLYKRMKYFPN